MAPISTSRSASHSTHGNANQLFSRVAAYAEIPSLFRRFTSAILKPRQSIVAIPTTYQAPANGPSPGTVVGIVLGVVLGLAFVLWVLYTVFNANNPSGATEVEIIKRGPRKTRPEIRSDRSRSEVIEVTRTRTRQPRRAQEVIVEEEIRRAPPPEDDDVVVVIEEHSPVRRERRSSGYRNVDPNEFGGGRRERRDVR